MLHQQDRTNSKSSPSGKPVTSKKSDKAGSVVNILLVEDIQSDALLFNIAVDSVKIPFSINRVKRGDEMIAILQKCASTEMQPPDVIILDLGLPGIDGFQVLSEIAAMPNSVRSIPIVVLTAHKNFEYIRYNYQLCIMSFLNKPCRSEELEEILAKIYREKLNAHI